MKSGMKKPGRNQNVLENIAGEMSGAKLKEFRDSVLRTKMLFLKINLPFSNSCLSLVFFKGN